MVAKDTTVPPHKKIYDLIWPDGLLTPVRPPQLVYLDLNHWIGLSKARLGHKDGFRYVALLKMLQSAVSLGVVKLVLSEYLMVEISYISDPRQRDDLVNVIDKLTDFEYLVSLSDLLRLETNAVLNRMTGTAGIGFIPIQLVGKGLLHAVGKVGGLRLVDGAGKDITNQVLHEREPELGMQLGEWNREAERMLLRGPADDEITELRLAGYRPENTKQILIDNAKIEQVFTDAQLDTRWRKGKLRDVLMARELFLELNEIVSAELTVRRLTIDDIEAVGGACQLVGAMPSACVRVEMKTHYHCDANKRWTANDLYDIYAMSLAVPYCDIVFTDAAARNAIIRTGLQNRMKTIIPRTPQDLNNHFEKMLDEIM